MVLQIQSHDYIYLATHVYIQILTAVIVQFIVAIPTPKIGEKRRDVPVADSDHEGTEQSVQYIAIKLMKFTKILNCGYLIGTTQLHIICNCKIKPI